MPPPHPDPQSVGRPTLRRAIRCYLITLATLILLGTCSLKWISDTSTSPAPAWSASVQHAARAVANAGPGTIDFAAIQGAAQRWVCIALTQLSALAIIAVGSWILLGRAASRTVTIIAIAIECLAVPALWLTMRSANPAAGILDAVALSVTACSHNLTLAADLARDLNPAASTILTALIFITGLGIPALYVLIFARRRNNRPNPAVRWARPTIIAALVLCVVATALLLTGRLTPHFFTAWNLNQTSNAEADSPLHARAVTTHAAQSLQQAITVRSAHCSVTPSQHDRPAARLITIPLMIVGSGPASPAGGMGLVATAVLLSITIATLRRRPMPVHTDVAFTAVVSLGLMILWILMTALVAAVPHQTSTGLSISYADLLLNTTAAASTVGTSSSTTAPWLLVLAALFGRIVPTYLALAICLQLQSNPAPDTRQS